MHASAATALLFSCILGLARSTPTPRAFTGCNVSNDVIPLPSGQTALTAPSGAKPIAIALGFGTQNYTCNAAGTYTSIGAVAVLYDASCVFNEISSIANKHSGPTVAIETVRSAMGSSPIILGRHYFVKNPIGSGVSPTFDFRADSQRGNPNAFVITSKIGDMPSPQDPSVNVDWLKLAAIPGQGDLATNAFRIFTLGGQSPKSCTPGSGIITVPYAANYWLFK